jgi:hypothetical protein
MHETSRDIHASCSARGRGGGVSLAAPFSSSRRSQRAVEIKMTLTPSRVQRRVGISKYATG